MKIDTAPFASAEMRKERAESETQVLRLLAELQKANQKKLAKELGLSPQTLRPVLAFLEGQGLVEHDESMLPHKIWQLTDAGSQELATRKSIASALDDKPSRQKGRIR